MTAKVSNKQLRSTQAVQQYQKKWFQETHKRIKGGEPCGICHADEVEEVFTFFGMPFIFIKKR